MANALKGMRCAVTGSLVGMSRKEAEAALRKVGATPTKAVSTKTDYLIAGSGAGSKVSKARAAGIRILDQQQFELLLEGGSLEEVDALEPEVEEIEEIPLEDALGQLRQLIYEHPSRELWFQICELLLHCPAEELPVAMDYLEQTTSHWPTRVTFNRYGLSWETEQEHRVATGEWTDQILNGLDSPIFHIVRVLDLAGRSLVGKVANRIFECVHLDRVTYLQLARNAKLPGSFYANLRTSEQFSQLTHLNICENHLSTAAVKGFAGETSIEGLSHLCAHGVRFAKAGEVSKFLNQPIFHELSYLDLSHCQLSGWEDVGAEVARAVMESGCFENLEYLDLYANYIGRDEYEYVPFLEGPGLSKLKYLDLGINELGDEYAEALAQASHLSQLETLKLGYSSFGAKGGEALLSAPHWQSLEVLDLSRVPLGSEAILELVKNPSLGRLRKLHLNGCAGINTKAVLALLESEQLAKLEDLDIGESDIDLQAVLEALLASTALAKLQTLYVAPQGGSQGLPTSLWKAMVQSERIQQLDYIHIGYGYPLPAKVRKMLKNSGLKEHVVRALCDHAHND